MKAGVRIKTATVRCNGVTYRTHLVIGSLAGRRIREQFKSRDEAEGRKNELEVEAANLSGSTRARTTRLTESQLAEAESAFTRLGGRSLSAAVEWYLATYRPPETATTLETAVTAFLAERGQHVRPVVLADYQRTLDTLKAAFPAKRVHDLATSDIQAFLDARKIGKKRFNNVRGELHAFFAWCKSRPRGWTTENPVAPIPAFKLTRGLPEIMTVQAAAELMAYVETYRGGSRDLPTGCMVPYFALCLFAGIRPCPSRGEIFKLANLGNVENAVNLALGVIRISPEVSKVKCVRQITIQPNLAAWLARYPLKKFPILPLGGRYMVQEIRKKFALGDDVLRHMFISMAVAKFRSLGDAALQAGNSESMIKKHYYNTVTASDAETFWAINPISN